jgi:hypothetical protein
MKKTLVAVAALAATASFAQVTLTGGLAAAYEKSAAGTSGMTQADYASNNITITAVDDIGGGMKVTAQANKRFGSQDGASTNSDPIAVTNEAGKSSYRDFQNATIAVSGGFGAVTMGRFQVSSVSGFDAFAGWGDRAYAYSSVTGNRNDNMIRYVSPNFNGLTVAFSKQAQTTSSDVQNVALSYSNGPLSAAYVNETDKNNVTDKNLGVKYAMKQATVYFLHGNAAGTTKNNTLGVTVPMGKITFKASARSGDSASQTAIGADYALSKMSRAFADFQNVSGGDSQYRVGIQTSF